MQPWPVNRPDFNRPVFLCNHLTMTSFLRPLAYRYRWIYDTVTAVSSLSVGGVERLRGLGLEVGPRSRPGSFRAWIVPHLRIWVIPVVWVPF